LAAAALVLISGLGLTWILFLQQRHQYELRLQKAIWPESQMAVAPKFESQKPSRPLVLYLGDSRMAYWGLPTFKHWNVVNAGVPGSTSGQSLLAVPGLMDQYRPQVVVVETGINDLKYLGLRPEMKDELVRLVVGNISNIASLCTARGSRVILLEIWPPASVDFRRRLVWNKAVDESVIHCNQGIRGLNSIKSNVRVLDLFQASAVQPSPETYLDTLHLKPETYRKLESTLEPYLDAFNSLTNGSAKQDWFRPGIVSADCLPGRAATVIPVVAERQSAPSLPDLGPLSNSSAVPQPKGPPTPACEINTPSDALVRGYMSRVFGPSGATGRSQSPSDL